MPDRDHRIDSADTLGAGFADTIGHADTLGGPRGDRDWGEALVGELVAERYDIVSLLGSGGMGAVYLARDRALDELVALKLLNPTYAAVPGVADVLQREVRLARRVTHRNVARTFDFARHEGQPFLTMEYIEGAALSRFITRDGGLTAAKAVPILLSVCAGLQAAHDAGIIHRDIKPDNILIANDGRVVVTDFGLARASVDDAQAAGRFSGTPRYMSPEQVEGRAASIRSDVFSIGVVAYELLSGKPPWHGETPRAEAEARLRQQPDVLSEVTADVPESLSRVVMRAMSRIEAVRYPSARLLSEALVDAVPDARAASAFVPSSSLVGGSVENTDPRSTLAVLPFANRGDAADAHIARGFSEDLVDSLAELSEVRVLSLGASRRVLPADGTPMDPHEAGQQLGVDLVISGWVRHGGDKVSVRVRATDVRDGYQRWSHSYDRPLSDLLTVSADVAQELSAHSRQTGARNNPMPSAEALDLYLRGREAYRFASKAHQAVDLFQRARRQAPDSPLINAGLAAALLRQWMMLNRDPGDLARQAAEAAQRAINAAPGLGEPYHAQALVSLHQGDIVGAVRGLRDAIARTPSLADAHGQLGAMLIEMGRLDEGRKRLETARRLDPSLVNFLLELRRSLLFDGDDSELDRFWEDAETGDRSSVAALQLMRFSAYARRIDDIRRLRDMVLEQPPDPFGLDSIIVTLSNHFLGELAFSEAYASLATRVAANGVSARRFCFAMQLKAELAGFAGRPELALDAVNDGDKRALIDLLWLERCPLLEDMRALPGYPDVHARIAERVNTAYDALWS